MDFFSARNDADDSLLLQTSLCLFPSAINPVITSMHACKRAVSYRVPNLIS